MTQYVVVVHNLSKDEHDYYGPYGDADMNDYYEEIKSFYKGQPDDYNCYIVQLRTFALKDDYIAISDISEHYEEKQNYANKIERREP